jgi:hypothetical protein
MKKFLSKNWRIVILIVLLCGSLGLFLGHAISRLETNPMGTPAVSDTPTRLWLDKIVAGNLYSDPGKVFNNDRSVTYPPIFYYLWYYLGGNNYIGGIITMLSMLLTGVFLYLIAKKIGLDKWSFLVPCLFFFTNTIVGWGSIPRPDGLALLLSVAGILVFLYRPLWSVPLFVLALFTKQTYFVTPLAVGLFLLTQSWKKGLVFGGLYLVVVAVCAYAVNHVLPGFISSIALAYKNNRPDNYWLRLVWISVVITVTNLVIPLAIFAWVKSKVKFGLFGIWFLVSLISMIILSGKWGSADNYGFELITVSCLLVTAFLGPIVDKLELKLKRVTA